MVKQREGYKFVILEPAKTWIIEGKCAGCGKPKSDWKRSITFKCCCKECTTKYVKECTYYGWPELRRKAIQRDQKCVRCGIKHTRQIEVEPEEDYYKNYEIIIDREGPYYDEIGNLVERLTLLDMSKYVVDHIHAIALGGEEWDINNLQTLCQECNKPKTKIDAGKIARLRFKEELGKAGQLFFDEDD